MSCGLLKSQGRTPAALIGQIGVNGHVQTLDEITTGYGPGLIQMVEGLLKSVLFEQALCWQASVRGRRPGRPQKLQLTKDSKDVLVGFSGAADLLSRQKLALLSA